MSLPLIRKPFIQDLAITVATSMMNKCLCCQWARTDAALSRHRYSACSST
ncbi:MULTISPECIES: hypothetical protein [unclassified Acinetobacter]|nr:MULTISPECIES: hypothetical protein [unclassified Acinetobacter]MDH0030621.1 hypothetical protein [Acinetobacter sp. GD04021]MDH0886268.1 hypothetical protein [Acinetobacter sp. GD03873]MDH1081757.1 hypothetical protein [Acinetobacter sp. GD03983]MDH2189745.1 hypothetical protein [Acinetobacter sp. GD03645]MDH2202737.1 hypothetical protein [Acinetobacter sp. GD03647]